MFKFPAVYLSAVLCAIAVSPAQALQRGFVASYGNDNNNCGAITPCRTFAKAVTVVDPNGEVVALDSAGYGGVTLTQSISLTAAPGVYAGISVPIGSGVIAEDGVNVVLRGLTINGQGSGGVGILMGSGKLSIENCVISNFIGQYYQLPFGGGQAAQAQYGILVDSQEAAATVRIVNSIVRNNHMGIAFQYGSATADISRSKFLGNTYGILVGSRPSTTTTVAINNSIVSGGNTGINATSGLMLSGNTRINVTRSTISNHTSAGIQASAFTGTGSVTLSNSMVTGNANGYYQSDNGTVMSLGNNTITGNDTNTGTLTPLDPI